jgi:hypothetical protein
MSRHSANGRPYWRLRRHWLASANHGWMIGCGRGIHLKQAANSGRWWNGDGAAAVLRTLSRSGTS